MKKTLRFSFKKLPPYLLENRVYFIQFLIFTAISIYWFENFYKRSNFQSFDWIKENFYFETLRESLISGTGIPLVFEYVPEYLNFYPALINGTSYIGNPETMVFSPFIVFIAFSTSDFIKILFYGQLLIAILSVVLIGKELRWPNFSTFLVFVCLLLSPWVVQHLVLGYSPWLQFYWVPLAFYLALKRRFVFAGLVSSLLLWGGAYHLFFWLYIGFAFSILTFSIFKRWSLVVSIFQWMIFTLIFSLPRILWILFSLGSELSSRSINPSYGSISDLIGLLTDDFTNPFWGPHIYDTYGTALYDSSSYIGWVGLFFFGVLFIISFIALPKWQTVVGLSGVLFFMFLGFDGVWKFISLFFPVVGASEVNPYRFFHIALVWAVIFTAVGVSSFLKKYENTFYEAFIFILFSPVIIELYNRTQYFLLADLPLKDIGS